MKEKLSIAFQKWNALSQKDKNCYAGIVGCVPALFLTGGEVGFIIIAMIMAILWMMTQ